MREMETREGIISNADAVTKVHQLGINYIHEARPENKLL